ncbi:MAG: tyrosine-type recombinase/integrase [Chloroflexi bacterium]|nr:tyrosine-type recombinase/integrase [Chloroflexota bacterium]
MTTCENRPRRNQTNKAYLEVDEVTRLEECATNLRDCLLLRLLSHSGCRISEILALSLDDINFTAGTITIQHLKTRLKLSCPDCAAGLGRSHAYCPKCGAEVSKAVAEARERRRQRTQPIDHHTLAMLKEYVERGGQVERNGRRLIFGINRHRAWQIVRDCAEKAGLPSLVNMETGRVHGVSPHRLRDAFATHAVKVNDSGNGLRLLQQHLGYASFNTTARYRKVSGEEPREWYQSLWRKEKPSG